MRVVCNGGNVFHVKSYRTDTTRKSIVSGNQQPIKNVHIMSKNHRASSGSTFEAIIQEYVL